LAPALLLVRSIVSMRTLFRNQSFILTRPPTLVLQMHSTFSRRCAFYPPILPLPCSLSWPLTLLLHSFMYYFLLTRPLTFSSAMVGILTFFALHSFRWVYYVTCILTYRPRLNLSYLILPSAKPSTPQLQRRVYNSCAISVSPRARRMMILNFEH
jgi:hypothetical protein